VEHLPNIGPDAVLNVMECSMVPVRVAGISPESLRLRFSSEGEKVEGEKEGD